MFLDSYEKEAQNKRCFARWISLIQLHQNPHDKTETAPIQKWNNNLEIISRLPSIHSRIYHLVLPKYPESEALKGEAQVKAWYKPL